MVTTQIKTTKASMKNTKLEPAMHVHAKNLLQLKELKPIPGFDKYFASIHGDIYSNKGVYFKKLKPRFLNHYRAVILRKDNMTFYKLIHRLICLTFLGESNLHVDHINRIKDDNKLCNLRYVTQKENSKNMTKFRRKIPQLVKDIICSSDSSNRVLSKKYKLSSNHILEIRRAHESKRSKAAREKPA